MASKTSQNRYQKWLKWKSENLILAQAKTTFPRFRGRPKWSKNEFKIRSLSDCIFNPKNEPKHLQHAPDLDPKLVPKRSKIQPSGLLGGIQATSRHPKASKTPKMEPKTSQRYQKWSLKASKTPKNKPWTFLDHQKWNPTSFKINKLPPIEPLNHLFNQTTNHSATSSGAGGRGVSL